MVLFTVPSVEGSVVCAAFWHHRLVMEKTCLSLTGTVTLCGIVWDNIWLRENKALKTFVLLYSIIFKFKP